ncbi:MAG TPA: TetR/AcrR family transcriptional regulator [Acidothermaceae bacterium]
MVTPTAPTDASSVGGGSETPSTRGTRSRAGNAMGRGHEAALRGALAAVEKYGSRKATMGDIAMLAGIAKATLYNHFRTRDDVYLAVVAHEVDRVAAAAREKLPDGLDEAIAEAARLIGEHAAVRKIAVDEPAALAALATPGAGPAWIAARTAIASALSDSGYADSPAAVDVVLRYLASQLLAPSTADDRTSAAELLRSAAAAQSPPAQTEPAEPAPAPDPADSADTSS